LGYFSKITYLYPFIVTAKLEGNEKTPPRPVTAFFAARFLGGLSRVYRMARRIKMIACKKIVPLYLVMITVFSISPAVFGQAPGYLTKDGVTLFPLGFYELPKEDDALRAMAEAGVNIVLCHSPEDLDRVHALGMLGVAPLGLDGGPTDALRAKVAALVDHPALAVWEGPDEVVWNFTAYSGLFRIHNIHKEQGAWWKQTPEAVAYARERAAEVIPNIHASVAMIRELDPQSRPVWINEAQRSDVFYVRQCLDSVDITGCDIYPVSSGAGPGNRLARVGEGVEVWKRIGRGKPVWMVLQAFSWDELGEYHGGGKERKYPTFDESRFMAYDVIARGASGIFYWGSAFLQSEAFRQSIYAVTAELAALQPFLVAENDADAQLELIEFPDEGGGKSVAMTVRRTGDDWLIILVNEDDEPHTGAVVSGLEPLEGRTLHLLYGDEEITVAHGELITRLMGQQVKVFCTNTGFETPRREGRDFTSEADESKSKQK
jgi:hypothetical protein